jgi:hypothetical protein
LYVSRDELFVGGNYLRAASGRVLRNTDFGGWNISATHYFTPLLGFRADFQGDYGHAPISSTLLLANNPFAYQHLFLFFFGQLILEAEQIQRRLRHQI